MSLSQRYALAIQKFEGSRFEDHGLDVDVLPELTALKTLMLETAKALWRAEHPGRERLDANFDDRLRLKFFELGSGSVVVPLERIYEVSETDLPMLPAEDEFDQAATLVVEAISATANSDLLPSRLPKSVLPFFEPLGTCLRTGERIQMTVPRIGKTAQIDLFTGSRFSERMAQEYTDFATIQGEVRSANLDNQTFSIRLQSGLKVMGRFEESHEQQLFDALHDRRAGLTRMEVKAAFEPDGQMKRIEKVISVTHRKVDADEFDENSPPIWEIVEALGKEIPEQEWAKLPDDASMKLDQYLYGPGHRSE
jgi:hypothetical protein